MLGHILLASTLLLSWQRLDTVDRVSYVDDEVVVRAIDTKGDPVAGLEVWARTPSNARANMGATSALGEVSFLPEESGRYEFSAQFPRGPVVIAVYNVVERPTRWLYALFLTPLGVLLVWSNLRRFRGPSPRAPGRQ